MNKEQNAKWINTYNDTLKNYPQGILSREAYSWADEHNKVLYYTPTVEELLIAIINDQSIYTDDECELKFTFGESVENKLMKFMEMNNKIGDDYFINNELYKLKLPKYRHYIKCAKCMKEHSRFYDCTLSETRQKELANLYKESEEDIFKDKGINIRTPYPTKEELDKAELENPGYSAHSRYGAIQLIEKHGK